MKKLILIILAMCMLLSAGCSKDDAVPENTEPTFSDVTENVEYEPQEFTEIEIPDGKTVFNSNMYDEDTVILMLGDPATGDYELALYQPGGDVTIVYSDTLHIEPEQTEGFSLATLSVQPYIVVDYINEVIYKFSDDFSGVSEISVKNLNTYNYEYCVARDSIIYVVSLEAACELREFSLTSGEDTLVLDLDENYSYIYLSGYCESIDTAILSGSELFTDEYVNFLVDVSEKTIIGQLNTDFSLYNSSDGELGMSWYTDSANDICVSRLDIQTKTVGSVYTIDMTDCIFSMNTDEYMFVFNTYGKSECVIRAYNIESGILIYESRFDYGEFSNIPVPVGHNADEPIMVYLGGSDDYFYSGDNLLFSLYSDNQYPESLILWNTSLAEVKQEYLTAVEPIDYPVVEIHEHNYSDSNTAYAETLETDFGVNIFYGDECDITFTDYEVECVYDEDAIFKALLALEETLNMFPDGFLAEFSHSGYLRGINFYLCGTMTPIGDDTITDPAAFTYTESGYAMVVVNVYQDHALVSHLCHELGHVIDNRLISEGYIDEEVWNSFNPEGFEYNNGYKGTDGDDYTSSANDDFTTYDESYLTDNDVEHIYFIDSYSKTYPTEDRARIIEYSMVPDAYTYEYFESSHLQAKLEYLRDCIRECWDSSGWVGKTQWEQFLIN